MFFFALYKNVYGKTSKLYKIIQSMVRKIIKNVIDTHDYFPQSANYQIYKWLHVYLSRIQYMTK